MAENNYVSKWTTRLAPIAEVAFEEAMEELRLSDAEKTEVRDRFLEVVERDLAKFVRCAAVVASLGTKQFHDMNYFKKKGSTIDNAEELAQATSEKILKALFANWPRVNIGAWRTRLRENVLNDAYRKRRVENSHMDARGTEAEAVDRCNPLRDSEALEELSKNWSPMEDVVLRRKLNGEEWPVLAEDFNTTIAELERMAREACPRTGTWSRRKKRVSGK